MIGGGVYHRLMSCEGSSVPRYWREQKRRYMVGGRPLLEVRGSKVRCELFDFEAEVSELSEKLLNKGFKKEWVERVMQALNGEDDQVEEEVLLEMVAVG